ncbi:hypothetical protein CLOP_g16370 [Closterium sp. NIES-67]|nr:hypothetical protein CLOP_g16370 [Closterium sp. NIES-67]
MDEQASIAVQQWVHAVTQASLPTTDGNGSGSGSGSVPASSGSGVCEIDMYAAFTTLALDIIGLAAFGSTVSTAKTVGSLEEEEEEGSVREVYEAVDTLSTRSTERMFSGRLAIPFYTWLPTQENRALWHAGERVRRLSLDLIARRRSSQAREPGKDLLAVMLAARDDVSNEQMTDQQLVDECVTFLVAGHETTAKLLTWAVYLLARHPEWQRRLREEALRVMGGGEKGKGNNGEGNEEGETGEGEGVGKQGEGNRGGMKVMWQHVGQLREMHMVLQETLRLFPPTPVISREASKDTSLGPYSIPAGTRIMMAIAMVQSDPRFWGEDALEFNPLRFKGSKVSFE